MTKTRADNALVFAPPAEAVLVSTTIYAGASGQELEMKVSVRVVKQILSLLSWSQK